MKNENAVALGSIKTAKKASSSRENGKKGGRPKLEYSFDGDWVDIKIYSAPKGWRVEYNSRIQGVETGRVLFLTYSTDFPKDMDMEGSWNECTSNAQALIRASLDAGRVLRKGQVVQ